MLDCVEGTTLFFNKRFMCSINLCLNRSSLHTSPARLHHSLELRYYQNKCNYPFGMRLDIYGMRC